MFTDSINVPSHEKDELGEEEKELNLLDDVAD
jgi:hypothetical protein